MELLEAFEDSFYPSIYLWPFDEGISMCPISVEDERWYAGRFQVSCGLDRDKISRGYSSWNVWPSVGISWSFRSSRPSRPSWCSSEGNVECVSDMLRVLMLVARGRFIVPSRYNGL